MSYQALLFCPDEKTARTVTQVLNELEFKVEACNEPFAAVKKLMGQHFDAVVVDCDNEQNATLLFKSARNSTSNQTSLAVAVVEGQAGVAKAFRIGANLVLTKPINIEQAKGTVRVARGLLRKGEPAKPAASAPISSPAAPVTAAPKPGAPKLVPTPTPLTTETVKPLPIARPANPVAAKTTPAPAWPAAAASAARPPQDDDLLGIEEEPAGSIPVAGKQEKSPLPFAARPAVSVPSNAGAASAPAPAREPVAPKVAERATGADLDLFEEPAKPASGEAAAFVGSAPTFTFGGSDAESESGGSRKKIFIGVAAAAILAGALYLGWTQFKTSTSRPAATQSPSTPAPIANQPAPTPSSVPAPVSTIPAAAAPAPEINLVTNEPAPSPKESTVRAPAPSNKTSSPASTERDVTGSPAVSPLVVKSGKATTAKPNTAVADAPAPSMIGMASPDAVAAPNLGTGSSNAVKPVLQTLSVSQGVSQGLLYKKASPVYPANAMHMKIEGKVELLATISRSGDITHISVLSGNPQLTRAASDAVKQWKYKPYLLNGEPVEIQTQVTINFKLPH